MSSRIILEDGFASKERVSMTDVQLRTSGRPTGHEVEAIEEALMSAAFAEFTEYGFAAASLTRVVARARMSKTTLYSRFSSKEALFMQLVKQQIESERPYENLISCVKRPDIAIDLERFAISVLNFSFQPKMFALNRVIMGEIHRFPALAQIAEEKLQRGIMRVSHYLTNCIEDSDQPITDAKGIAEAFIHMVRGWYLHRLFAGMPTTDEEVRTWARKAIRALIRPAPCW